MNPYVKIAIKVGVVVVICLILLVAYNMIGHKAFVAAAESLKREIKTQEEISNKLDSLLQYKELLPKIRAVQLQDMETIRLLIPPADKFVLTGYLRQIHSMLTENRLETDGIVIAGTKGAVGAASFEEIFASDVTALQADLEKIKQALQMFQDNLGQMNNMIMSFQFYQALATGMENYTAIAGGVQMHSFSLTVKGSYQDIKKFTYDVFNMKPHTALVNFQMSPIGGGFGASRLYQASFTLITYGDANATPPLWDAYHRRGEKDALKEIESGQEQNSQESVSEGGSSETAQPPVGEAAASGQNQPQESGSVSVGTSSAVKQKTGKGGN